VHPGSSSDCASGDHLKRGARVDLLPLVCMDDTDPVYSDCRTKPNRSIFIFGVLSFEPDNHEGSCSFLRKHFDPSRYDQKRTNARDRELERRQQCDRAG